jgi:hypothetical protein
MVFHAGFAYQLWFFDRVVLPIGTYVRNSTFGDNDGGTTTFRIGLGYRF